MLLIRVWRVRWTKKILKYLLLTVISLLSYIFLIFLIKSIFQGPPALKLDYDNNSPINFDKILESHPNFPIDHSKGGNAKYSATCARYATPFDIKHNNVYWQVQRLSQETYYLYGAYYDSRPKVGPAVRILGVREKAGLNYSTEIYCQLWFSYGQNPIIAKVDYIQYLFRDEWGFYHEEHKPYMLSCMVPPDFQGSVPDSVSLVESPCENATNNLRVIDNRAKGEKEDFVVCVKCLNFKHRPDIAVRLVEWIELLKILGANKIVFYSLQVNSDISKVLRHYQETWNVEVVQTSLPGTLPNVPDFMYAYLSNNIGKQCFQDLIDYNDCFYKNFNLYNFAVLIDIDEVIMPVGSIRTWKDLLAKVPLLKKHKPSDAHGYSLNNVYFMDDKERFQDWNDDIPRYMHMLQHVHRMAYHSPIAFRAKSFHATRHNLALHNHFGRACISPEGKPLAWCRGINIPVELGYLHHYCVKKEKLECKFGRGPNSTVDENIWKYKDELIPATKQVLKSVGIL
ncbi:uncharacterized protein LOC135945862 [Cloeon dipterum]|uniref:uncharacterized protein LOC135945862 n=1 Tax=Cloeon dipterum TaxID=197152 RepID=UPI0032206A90